MKDLISGVQWIIGLGLIPYAIAVIMPTWRWLLGVTLVIGGPLSALWIQHQHWIASSAPDYYEGPIEIYILIVTAAFAVGVGIRATTLIFAPKGLHLRYIFVICVAGFAIVPVIPFAPSLWHAWNIRPPSEACSGATFHVKVANADFSIPAWPIFNVYLGQQANTSSPYYFYANSSLRGFCRLSDNGKQAVTATKILFEFDFDGYRNIAGYRNSATMCAGSVPESAKTFCIANAKPAEIDSIDFPRHVTLDEFDGSGTYEDSQRAIRSDRSVFITSEALTPDQHPLTFECAEIGTGFWCHASYPWRDGTSLSYVFQSPRGDVAARGGRIDVETRKFLSGFAAQHRS